MSNFVAPKIGIMIDLETFGLGATAPIVQIGMLAWNMADPEETVIQPVHAFLPLQPQTEQLIPPRSISAQTAIWWMKQDADARARFDENDSIDFDELMALLRHFVMRFKRAIDGLEKTEYEVWARGPQFDIVTLESLLRQCGLEVPWYYASVRDLRTLMASSGLDVKDVAEPEGFMKHDALWDCKFQLACYLEAMRIRGSRS